MKDVYNKLPEVKFLTGIQLLIVSCIFLSLAILLKPHKHFAIAESDFNSSIPKVIQGWKEAPQLTPQVSIVSDEKSLVNQLYDDVLMRTYVDSAGKQIMLALAYAKMQRQDIKIHQPDICYPAQGFQLLQSRNAVFPSIPSKAPVIGKQQLYFGHEHLEAVTYWIRVGDRTLTSGMQMRLKIIEDGLLKGRFDDGILVRVSSIIANENEAQQAFTLHEKFLKEFVSEVALNHPTLLVP